MTTLLVAKNDKTSLELLRFIERLIQDGDSAIEHKISQVVKGKDKTKMPAIIKPNGEVLADINQIYLFLAQKPNEVSQRRQPRHSDYDPYELSYEDRLDREIDIDDDGSVVKGEHFDDQKVSRRRRDGDDSEEEDEMPRASIAEMSEQFFRNRSNIQSSIHRKRPSREERGRPTQRREEAPIERHSKPKSKSKRKYESSDESDESSYDSGEDLDTYMQGVIHSRDD